MTNYGIEGRQISILHAILSLQILRFKFRIVMGYLSDHNQRGTHRPDLVSFPDVKRTQLARCSDYFMFPLANQVQSHLNDFKNKVQEPIG